MKSFAENRKARYDYEILEKFEGGLALTGQEVKSIRDGGARLQGSYIQPFKGELWILGFHIPAYKKIGKIITYDPTQTRKILVHRKELEYFLGKTQQKGLTLVPLSLYPSGRRIKLSFALCRGKKAHDKREKLKERDIAREGSRM